MRIEFCLSIALCAIPLCAQDHAGQYTQADIERGSRLYALNCALCHGVNGDSISNVDLKSGRFRNATSDEDLAKVVANGLQGTAMPPHKFDTSEMTGVIAYIRSMRDYGTGAVAIGEASAGKAVFEGKGACLSCHRVGAAGSRVAPDLTDIGSIRSASALERSLLDPNAAMLPINRSVRIVTKAGKVINGRRLNEDTYSVQLMDEKENLLSLNKADLREYKVITTSPMPSFKDKLSAPELADLLAYLLTLKGIN